jgi:hypothetical protein
MLFARELPRVVEYVVPGISSWHEHHWVVHQDMRRQKPDLLSTAHFALGLEASMTETVDL